MPLSHRKLRVGKSLRRAKLLAVDAEEAVIEPAVSQE